MTFLHNIGLYIIMLQKMFQKPTKWEVMKELILKDTEDTVINSLGIISFVSFFIGGVITIHEGKIIIVIPKYFEMRLSFRLAFRILSECKKRK